MSDDGHAPTIPETQAPTHPRSLSAAPHTPDARYEMRALLGKGGMGEVWLAYDLRVDREVAVKLMRGDGAHDPASVARFLREARVQGRLEHPAIVPVHDLGVGDAEAAPYFTMKRLTGTNLADVLQHIARGDADARERWPVRTLLARLVDVCLAIELSHRRGVIHRDLKPANIMLGDFGETYVLDWGLARIHDAPEIVSGPIRASDLPGDSAEVQTMAGAILGTPGYMPPEQIRGELVDPRADIYALGCILFEILAGEPATSREDAIEETLSATEHRPRRTLVGADLAPELDDACARATAGDRAARYSTARALADDLQRFLDGDRDLARRRALAAEHAAAAAAALALGDAGRADAMRDAGRAIAIDPENREAQDLMKRLLFELPREVPPEAQRAIEADRAKTIRAILKKGAAAYALNLLIVPVVKLLGVTGTWPFVVVTALLLVCVATCVIGYRRASLGRAGTVIMMGAHVLLLAATGMLFGPILFAPIFALGSLPIWLMFPGLRMPKLACALHLIAIGLPLLLEQLGVLPASVTTAGGALVIRPWAIGASPAIVAGLFLAIVASQMFVTTAVFSSQRAEQETSERRVHVFSWHLAQLVR